MGARIYISNLPFSHEEDALRGAIADVLSAYGKVVALTCVCESSDIRPKGLWFVEMASDEDAARVIANLDGILVGGFRVRVGPARPRLHADPHEIPLEKL